MKTVSGKITSTRPVTLSTASKVLSKFITVDYGASPAISIYLRKASEAFEELNQLHKGFRAPKSDRKSRKTSALEDSVDTPPRETETEDVERDQMKHRKKKKKAVDGDYTDNGLVEANEDPVRTVEQELANGDEKPMVSEGKKKKRKSKNKQLNGGVGNATESITENGEEKGEDGNTNEAEGTTGIKKKKKKKRGGDVDAGMGENGNMVEDRDRGKKRKIEVTREGGEENGSTEQPSKKKKKNKKR